MQTPIKPLDHILWQQPNKNIQPCKQNMHVQVAIIGGGMAGLSAAQAFANKGKKVAVFEQYFCGSGASGKSSGFITPNAELSCIDFENQFGRDGALKIWNMISGGVQTIKNNIADFNIDCEFAAQDSIMLASSKHAVKKMQQEHQALQSFNYPTTLLDQQSVRQHIASNKFFGGIIYPDTFSINAYAYCQGMVNVLKNVGVMIFEESPVIQIEGNTLHLPDAQVTADHIVVCVDRFLPNISDLKDIIYQVQNFIIASKPMTDHDIKKIFPNKRLLAWDSELIYNYFRITPNNRIILGGGDFFSMYANKDWHDYQRINHKLQTYFNNTFPEIFPTFEYQWSGLIGVSKDIAPLIGPDKNNPAVYYIAATAGLPIACGLGNYSAQAILDNDKTLEQYFSVYRDFKIQGIAAKILGKKLSFAMSHGMMQDLSL